jgi:hypothetical protein
MDRDGTAPTIFLSNAPAHKGKQWRAFHLAVLAIRSALSDAIQQLQISVVPVQYGGSAVHFCSQLGEFAGDHFGG